MRQMTLPYRICVSAVCLLAALALPSDAGAATVTPTPPPTAIWLDQQPLSNWNRAGLVVPAAPPANGERATSGRCTAPRAPVSAEERAITGAGWSLYKVSDQQQTLTIIHANVTVDGMCRPWQYQAFVFVGGMFAGTLAPTTMNARTDGALTELTIGAEVQQIVAKYQRYAPRDPLCCPSRNSTVTFTIDATARLISPTLVVTAPNVTPPPAASPAPIPTLPGLPTTGGGGGAGTRWPLVLLVMACGVAALKGGGVCSRNRSAAKDRRERR